MSDHRLIIAATRGFKNRKLFNDFATHMLEALDCHEVLIRDEGTEIDYMVKDLAEKLEFTIVPFPAYWKKEGSEAGTHRNHQLSLAATHALIFWDGFSKDISDLMRQIKQQKLKGKLVIFDHEDPYGHQHHSPSAGQTRRV